jgi:hypothetical protein
VSICPRFIRRSTGRLALGLAVASTLVFSAVVPIAAASAADKTPPSTPTSAAPHCLTRVTGKSASGELQLSTPECYATFASVLLKAGGGGDVVALSGNFIIGTHYDGANFTGASISVQGSDCYGGYINLTGWWANRVSSTINGCPQIDHYFWPNLGGSSEATTGFGGNLFWLNNLSESIAYNGW